MKITIKKINNGQIAELAALADQIWHEFFPGIISRGQIDYMVEKFQSVAAITDQLLNQGYEYYFIWAGEEAKPEELAGFIGIKPESGALFLSKLYLKKEMRGKRISSAAFSFLEEYCHERHLFRIWLTVNKGNASSIAVYKKKGFHTFDAWKTDIGGGYVMDDFIMEKKLG